MQSVMGIAIKFSRSCYICFLTFLMVHGLLYNKSSSQFCYSYIIIFSCLLFFHHFNLLTDFNCISFYVLCPLHLFLFVSPSLLLYHYCTAAPFAASCLHFQSLLFSTKLFLFLPIVLIKCL